MVHLQMCIIIHIYRYRYILYARYREPPMYVITFLLYRCIQALGFLLPLRVLTFKLCTVPPAQKAASGGCFFRQARLPRFTCVYVWFAFEVTHCWGCFKWKPRENHPLCRLPYFGPVSSCRQSVMWIGWSYSGGGSTRGLTPQTTNPFAQGVSQNWLVNEGSQEQGHDGCH